MKPSKKIIVPVIMSGILSACSGSINNWQANNYADEFSNTSICRVERGTEEGRQLARSFSRTYFTQNFYAENNNGQIRVGVRSEPALPITGDVQIKVGQKLYTLTVNDTPLDYVPSGPALNGPKEFTKGYNQAMEGFQKYGSPYRAFTGNKAKTLLNEIVKSGEEVKFRMVGVNSSMSTTASFIPDEKFVNALKECNLIK